MIIYTSDHGDHVGEHGTVKQPLLAVEEEEQEQVLPAEAAQRIKELVEDNALPGYKHFRQLAKQALAARADLDKANRLATTAAIAFQETYLYVPLLWAGYAFMVKPRIQNLTLNSLAENVYTLKGVTLNPVSS